MSDIKRQLAAGIQAVIRSGTEGDPAQFDQLACDIFAYQYDANTPYRQFCDARGVRPGDVNHWSQIPAFPTDAFKRGLVTSFPKEEAVMAQLTSGTTANKRGEIFRDETGRELIFDSNRMMTESYLFPDMKQRDSAGLPRCRVLILSPGPAMAPTQGMAIGMEETRVRFGAENSQFLLDRSGINIKGLVDAFEQAEESGQPVALIGATGAFVYFFQACRKKKLSFRLPEGSRIGDGGGYRGRFGEVDRNDYFRMAEEILAISADHCVNVLGMAESATNFFENPLRNSVLRRRPEPRRFLPPPWVRTDVVDPVDLSILPAGETGLLRHFDLANLPTVLAVQSDNLGVCEEDGSFRIIGRAKVADGRVSMVPDDRTVGPLGDNRIFRFLEHYVNFSVRFKMGRITGRKPRPITEDLQGSTCTCGEGVEQIIEHAEKSP